MDNNAKSGDVSKAALVITGAVFVAIALFVVLNLVKNDKDSPATSGLPTEVEKPIKKDRVSKVEITEKATFSKLLQDILPPQTVQAIYDSAKRTYDLAKIRVGYNLELIFDKDTDSFKQLIYKIDSEDQLVVSVGDSDLIKSVLEPIPYEVKIEVLKGEVKTSMYQAALDNNIDLRAIIDLANAFQWTIDFATDPRVGDKFAMVVEQRYLNDKYVMPGRVLAGRYMNDGTPFEIYYFEESKDNSGYFDGDGKSTQRMFLKAPVEFKYISSGFTTGKRYVDAFNVATGHRAIDYAAPTGTPIRAVGDGIVTRASWSPVGYGNLTSIRHNGTYSTNYAHQSRFLVRVGQRVKQGQIIGKVGTTGFSTGPHLHFEMVKNGVKINPLREILPPGRAINKENKPAFEEVIKKHRDLLGQL